MRPQVQLQIDPSWAPQVDEARLRHAVRTTLRREGITDDVRLTLVIVNDEEMSRLHTAFREATGPTDVLAFPFEVPAPLENTEEAAYLGDVMLCYPQAERQALAEGHTPQEELILLTVHGVLHLLGYDDERPDARTAMWQRQAEIMAELDLEAIAPKVQSI